MNLDALLTELVARKGSDLFITVGTPPTLKVNGHLQSLTEAPLDKARALALVKETLSPEHFERYLRTKEANYAIHREELGRFRVSAFWQQELPGMVLRRIETRIPTFDELALPPILQEIALAKRGLVLFVGATGAGKSTTQAAMIGYRNQHVDGHILTVEDPVEFVHQHGRSLITQREVGIDTASFDVALKSSLRQAPDVILIGEIRSQETMEFALQFAETGHLCLATLHANNANQALDRILHLVPQEKHRQFLFDLSFNLRAIVAQQLLPSLDGRRRCAAFEVLLNTPLITDIVRKGEVHRLKEVMTKSTELGMQTFDQALFKLFCAGQIGYSEALAHADSANDLRLLIKLSGREQLGAGTLDNVTLDE
ncbi:type IVa pilus ATPase TapU [Aeromonas hydrophila]|uniref:type IVa pilus ATPase TapU n=1 Tax=Aeromonas hydrophila TaxID=644 RepID=UPI00188F127B|nr:type IVa pilus ATPase TapU [Aeromonas hydrophila]MBF4800225.1 PilT/PilU family type 4a pilus ATPase [Aeromonas hydrophila]